jgi:dipeptidyl aminopeptidase/acylaminoacyl peptidase
MPFPTLPLRLFRPGVGLLLLLWGPGATPSTAQRRADGGTAAGFTLAQVKGYPFPSGLQAASRAERLVWAFNEQGQRNLWVAEGPDFVARRLTNYTRDDGQELSAVSISPDGQHVIYVRGGDFGSNFDDALPVNPVGMPIPSRVQLFTVPFAGGTPVSLGDGLDPVISPASDAVVFTRDRQLWRAPIDGSAPAVRLTGLRGSNGSPEFSPDGSQIVFVSNRGDHALIGVYTNDTTPVRWLAPSADRDWMPRWSPDGTRVVFARRAGSGGAPAAPFENRPAPWSLHVATVRDGTTREIWASDTTMRASVPSTEGGINLHWGTGDRVVFVSFQDGWPHLYSVSPDGGTPVLLTPGNFMVEHVRLAVDGRSLVFSANTGPSADDIDRRHIMRVSVDRADATVLTPGDGLEWTPVVLGSGTIAGISATPQRPPLPMVLERGRPRLIAADRIPAEFPTTQLVTPQSVVYTAADGVRVHAQLFLPPGSRDSKRPAIVYVHGGPSRQMLLGWHYGDYYANAYAMNQYLASRGFVVLSVNYRLGIGYGYDFYRPAEGGASGASEYRDVKAAAELLRTRADVDGARIGIYGGSYGGFLTALALGRDSRLFAAGVDIHGVHDFTADGGSRFGAGAWRYERTPAQLEQLADVAWRASPVSAVSTWTSPVLLIHGDDDRNVRFNQTVDLIQRLRAQRVTFESIIIPDDTHHWMRHANQLRVNEATASFLERTLGVSPVP